MEEAVEGDEEVEGDRLVEMENGTIEGGGRPANAGRVAKPSFWIHLLFRELGSRLAEVDS